MSTRLEVESSEVRSDHSILRYCVPMIDPSQFRSYLAFHCDQYSELSAVKNPRFKIDVELFKNGKRIAQIPGSEIDSTQILEFDFSALVENECGPILAIASVYRPSDQGGIDPYVNHFHRSTGMIVSHPMVMFMGDDRQDKYLSIAFENSLFWAGLTADDAYESCLIVANPYPTSLGVQISIYGEGKRQHSTDISRLAPQTFQFFRVEDLFPALSSMIGTNRGLDYSLCVATQYSAKALFGIRHRTSGYFTTLDHLHEYLFR